MGHLVLILHLFIGATLAGVGLVALLVTGFDRPWALMLAVLAGFAIAVPVAKAIARALDQDG
jgi:hypothetical protein